METMRMALLQWSEFIKITKFGRQIGVSPQAISMWLKYGQPSLSENKKLELYKAVLDYMKRNFA